MKALSLLLALIFALLVLCTGCGKGETPEISEISSETPSKVEEENKEFTLTLPYAEEDALSPVKLKGRLNDLLTNLFYEGLYTLDEGFNPVPVLAKEISFDGATCTVVLKEDLVFSDGKELSAGDVVASFRALKNAPVWKERLGGVLSVTAVDKRTLRFTLKKENRNAAALLTFPVFKKGTENAELPVGSGRYVAQRKKGTWELTPNKKYPLAKKLPVQTIRLQNIPDHAAVFYSVKSGGVDMVVATAAELAKNRGSYLSCNSLSMVYLGINNRQGGVLQDANLRQALFSAADRSNLTESAFGGVASVSYFPVHPASNDFAAVRYDTSSYDKTHAEELLSGYRKNKNGKLLYGSRTVNLTLLVNEANNAMQEAARLLAKDYADLGITIEIKSCSLSELKQYVAAGNYDLYLSEVHLSKDQNLDAFLTNDSLVAGVTRFASLLEAGKAYEAGGSLSGFLDVFAVDVPFVPLCFLQEVVMTSRDFPFLLTPSEQNPFYRMEDWERVS